MIHGGTFHNGFSVEQLLKPYPGAFRNIMEHQGMQSASIVLPGTFRPFRSWHPGTGSGQQKKEH